MNHTKECQSGASYVVLRRKTLTEVINLHKNNEREKTDQVTLGPLKAGHVIDTSGQETSWYNCREGSVNDDPSHGLIEYMAF